MDTTTAATTTAAVTTAAGTVAVTKLTVPMPVRSVVARPHLVEHLDRPGYRVGLLSAPAGFGKTALLASWADARRDSVAWLSCDASDSEPTRFWRGLLASVGHRWPGVGDDAAILLERSGTDSHDLAISLANDLGGAELRGADPGGVERPAAIVIDDFHLARPTPAVFSGLVGALPPTVRLVLGSRIDPLLPLGRLRVAGELMELRGPELCFSPEETAAALAGNDVALQSGEMSQLHELTEGWPAGVQLGALALRRASDRTGFLQAFASTDRAVADFLVGEVLDRLPPDLVEFLDATAVLDEFDVALCEAVTGDDAAALLLEQLVAANLFVVRLDVGGGWYRYHHLFGAFLRARLRSLGQQRWRDAHERAALALEARGDIIGAFRHASAAGDLERAAAITRATVARLLTVVEPDATAAAARHWLNRRGRDLVVTDPEQVLEYLLPLVAVGSADDATWWFEALTAAHPEAGPTLTAMLEGTRAEHHLCRGEAEEAVARSRIAFDAVEGRPPRVGALPGLPVQLARAHLQVGDRAGAGEVLAATQAVGTGHPVADRVRAPAVQAWIGYLDGELHRSERRCTAALAAADDLQLPGSELGRVYAGLVRAGLHLEHDEEAAAGALLDQLGQDVDLGRRPPLQSLVAAQRARFARIVGDEEAAQRELTLARLLLPNPSPSVRAGFALEVARQALRFHPSAATALVDALDGGPAACLLRARLALEEGVPGRALELLDEVSPVTTVRARVTRGVLTARALRRRDLEAASAALGAVLAEAAAEGFRRTVLGQGPDVLELLLSFPATPTVERYVTGLIDAASSAAAPVRLAPPTLLVDPLSDREVTVLRYLCSRLTYQEIAAALFVSHNTLKSHVRSVYRKLGVGSRREAVEAGRRLRLV